MATKKKKLPRLLYVAFDPKDGDCKPHRTRKEALAFIKDENERFCGNYELHRYKRLE